MYNYSDFLGLPRRRFRLACRDTVFCGVVVFGAGGTSSLVWILGRGVFGSGWREPGKHRSQYLSDQKINVSNSLDIQTRKRLLQEYTHSAHRQSESRWL